MEIKHPIQYVYLSLYKKSLIFLFISFCFYSLASGQTPKTGRMYFLMQQDSLYQQLSQKRLNQGASHLDSAELQYVNQHEAEMELYFKDLPDKEQSNYFRYQDAWKKDYYARGLDSSSTPKKKKPLMEGDYNGNRIRYMFYALQGGGIYGLTSILILQDNSRESRILNTFPIFAGVGSFLVPAIWTQRYGNMSYPAFRLGSHGINMGPIYGYALSNFILAGSIEYPSYDLNGTRVSGSRVGPIIGMAIMSGTAAAAAIASYNIGKNRSWHDSRALTLRTYARIGCLSGLIFPTRSVFPTYDDNSARRLLSITFLAGAGLGYGIGHWVDRSRIGIRTRGEAIVAESFTFQGIAPGMLMTVAVGTFDRMSYMMIPAGMTAFGLISNFITRGTELTPEQGRAVAISSWAANAGATLATIIATNTPTPLSIIPGSLGSFITAYFISRRFKKYNSTHPTHYKSFDKNKRAHVNLSLTPSLRLISDRPASLDRNYARLLPDASLHIRF
jgi:hypothetical protein